MGCESFTEGFGPLMEGFDARVPLDDIDELDRQLRSRDVAAFVIETVQGKGCQTPKTDFFPRAQELCRKYGTLLISDEVQTGLGRTGKMFGFQHWNLEPDIITLAKTFKRRLRAVRRHRHPARHLPENVFADGPVCRAFHHLRPQQSRDGVRTGMRSK